MKPTSTSSLRAALQLALAVARQGEAEQPPIPAPGRLRPYLSFTRAPNAALEMCRRVLDDDDEFRGRVAGSCSVDQVGSIAWLWLTRPDNWEATTAELQAGHEREAQQRSATRRNDELQRQRAAALSAAQLAEQQRRELAAELEAARAEAGELTRSVRELQAELVRNRLDSAQDSSDRARLLRQLKEAEALVARRSAENRELRAEVAAVRRELAAAGDERRRLLAGAGSDGQAASSDDTDPSTVPESPLVCVPGGLDEATPGGLGGQSPPESARPSLRSSIDAASAAAQAMATALAAAAAALDDADTAAAAVTADAETAYTAGSANPMRQAAGAAVRPLSRRVRVTRRRALRMPAGTFEESERAAAFLVRVPQVLFLVDGYNVAKQGWPELELRFQRERLLDCVLDLQSRTGVQADVVFDGIDDGALQARMAPTRVRVEFTASDVEADDRLLELVELTPLTRPVVVVSSDRRVRDGARDRGANTLYSSQLLALFR